MANHLTRRRVQELLRLHAHEILTQLGTEEVIIGISMSNSEVALTVSVPEKLVSAIPDSVTIDTDEGKVVISTDVRGDYEPIQIH